MSTHCSTFSNQHSLPKLPVPSLQQTAERYLRSLEPCVSGAELEKSKAVVKDFLKPGGMGEALQERLLRHAETSKTSWIEDWWIRKAYLEWRAPLLVNSNWFLQFTEDINQSKVPREDPNGGFTKIQVKRAAHLINKFLDYKELIDSERLPPESNRLGNLCMNQYRCMFGVCRIPKRGCDEVVYHHSEHPQHIILLLKDQIYEFAVFDQSKNRITDGDIEKKLWEAIEDVQRTAMQPSVGVLTSDDRDNWADAREHLLSIDPTNRASLARIQSALFAVCLDDRNISSDLNIAHRNTFTGMDGHNRWFDTCMSIVLDRNGNGGVNGEHSPCDALIPSLVIEYALQDGLNPNALPTGAVVAGPKLLKFKTDPKLDKMIQDAHARAQQVIMDSTSTILQYKGYGTDFIKQYGKVSPDAYVQMAMQAAYYRAHRSVAATYETASTRMFLHGRTETIRVLTNEAKQFALKMNDPNASAQEKFQTLQLASRKHIENLKQSSIGQGVDRHLFGLRMVMKPGEGHAIFSDPAFGKSSRWQLSTSSLSESIKLSATGFGAVDPEGYGINYLPGKKTIRFGIEAKANSNASIQRFSDALIHVLNEMEAVCKANTPKAKL
ncbi:acyltransferase ChoActase/COT/CPT [Basidiobolus meristosporus CBS 931.73]|uniref:Acyltransferase ChoActase/COT/CPT n=1 Tax=Basidiobolus meristosporus CBS 931.73 TaxID=1314790 RepID=A0A1Y1X3J1_9FUNG|nr:acyltransferase ChoActase/COT/CPT [Basidiobolus meristosporus CBS 931.73]|eukprot:ORX80380.1 acyltransferase ChoActase/COT/CPT [Basidiobolus meristosporus CBS 931.73]